MLGQRVRRWVNSAQTLIHHWFNGWAVFAVNVALHKLIIHTPLDGSIDPLLTVAQPAL